MAQINVPESINKEIKNIITEYPWKLEFDNRGLINLDASCNRGALRKTGIVR
jgi:hypothetical protein